MHCLSKCAASPPRVKRATFPGEVAGFFYHALLQRSFLAHAVFGGVFADVFGDLHRAKVRTAHRAPASASQSWRVISRRRAGPCASRFRVRRVPLARVAVYHVPGLGVKLAAAAPGNPQLFAEHSPDRLPFQRHIPPRMIKPKTTARPWIWRCARPSGCAWMSKIPIRAEVPVCTVYAIEPRPVGWTTP